MKKLLIAATICLSSCGVVSQIEKGITKDCKPGCDKIIIVSGATGKQVHACYCDSNSTYRRLVETIEKAN